MNYYLATIIVIIDSGKNPQKILKLMGKLNIVSKILPTKY